MSTAQPAAAAPVAPTVLTPIVAVATPGGLVPVLESLRVSADADAVALFNKAAPWYVKLIVSSSMITQAVDYGFAMVEGAAKAVIPSPETAAKVVGEAIAWIDAHEPSFAEVVTGPVEDFVISHLQSLGWLPASFSRATLPKAA